MSDDDVYRSTYSNARETRESADEIARRFDERYSIQRESHESGLSSLAWISAHQAELAERFRLWWQDYHGGEWQNALPRFEVAHFGAELYPAARGLLGFAIWQNIWPDSRATRSLLTSQNGPTPTTHVKRPEVSPQERMARFDRALGEKARKMSMTDQEAQKRQREVLAEQARLIYSEAVNG